MANLINSLKAFGEKITGEEIEGETLIDSMKDMGKKMTGKEIEGNSLLAIIDETTEGYEGGDGGASMIEVPAHSRLVLDGPKLLQLLIAKNVDVDAEIEDYYSYSSYYAGLLLGGTIEGSAYLNNNVSTHAIFPCVDYDEQGNTYGIRWMVCQNSATYTTKPIEHIEHITFKTMLQALGTVDVDVFNEIKLVPYVALKTSSAVDARPVDITTDEFLSFLTIIPLSEEQPA